MRTEDRRALFVMTVPSSGDSGPIAHWIIAASWAAAARRVLGEAWVLSPEGVFSPEEASRQGSRSALAPRAPRWWRGAIPPSVEIAIKDARELARARRLRRNLAGSLPGSHEVEFVWQYHAPFHWAGFEIARRLKRPLILHVDAPQVWESRRWGVRRPGWGRLLEASGERPQFRAADLVVCPSEEIAEATRRRGADPGRILVTPNGVDTTVFRPNGSRDGVRDRLGLGDRTIVGWVGSFRPFHGLSLLVETVAGLQRSHAGIALLLVGDGQERPRLEAIVRERRMRDVVITGTVTHEEVSSMIGAMDIAVLPAERDRDFHYSPIKLREYMACGKAIVASHLGEIGGLLSDGLDALLVPAGDGDALTRAIERLANDSVLRQKLGAAARAKAVDELSWDRQLNRVRLALDQRSGSSVGA